MADYTGNVGEPHMTFNGSSEVSEISQPNKRRESSSLESVDTPSQGPELDCNGKKETTMSRRASTQSIRLTRSHNGYSCADEPLDKERGLAEKDGFEIVWENGDNDPMNPRSWGKVRKWMIVLICAFTSVCVTCTSSAYSETYDGMEKAFNSSQEVATLGLTIFVVGLGFGPMLLAPLSEFYGRRPIYIVSMFFFVVWLVPCAVAQNMATEIIARFFNGFAGSAFLSVSGGTVSDLFPRSELQAPMLFFTAAPFVGPSLGPLIGGFICEYTDWRWTFYVLLIWAGVMEVLIICFVPETYNPVCLKAKAAKIRKETGDDRWKSGMERSGKTVSESLKLSVKRPFQLLAREPMVQCLCLFSALLLGILYLFFGAFPLVFGNNHGFTQVQSGMTFLGILVGMVIGVCCDLFFQKYYNHLVSQREADGGEPGGSEPEYRLPPLVVGAPLVTIGIFWFGWTSYSSIPWIVPILGSGVFGMGTVLSFSGIFTFLVDAYPEHAASALAANSFTRSTLGSSFPLFGNQMYENLGYEWATSLLGFLSLAMLPFPYLFFKYGKKIRGRSSFAKTTS